MKSLHLTLAYQFQPDDFEKLKQLIHDTIDSNLLTQWEIRLYSRDTRVAGKLVKTKFDFISSMLFVVGNF